MGKTFDAIDERLEAFVRFTAAGVVTVEPGVSPDGHLC